MRYCAYCKELKIGRWNEYDLHICEDCELPWESYPE